MERVRAARLATRAVKAGGESMEDFDALVRAHRQRIYWFLLASVRNRETGENLTQDCFLKAYQAREQFRGASSPATWFLQIAANLVRDHESSGRLKFWRHMLRRDADVNDLSIAISDPQQSPETLALRNQQVQSIWTAAANLPAQQRTVFLLRFVEDMNLLEIAEVTGMKEGTVKAHLFRALQSVRARLEGTK